MNKFVESLGFDELSPMAGDMSPRKYFRGVKEGESSIIMLYPDATPETREELQTFIRVGEYLRDQGLKAPGLYALDEELLCAHFEDLGETSFGDLLRAGENMEKYYRLACDVLKHIKDCPCPDDLPDYRDSHIHYKRRQLVQYYLPFVTGKNYTETQMEDYLAAWGEIESGLGLCPQGFLHMDYHLENLVLVEKEEGIKRCGLVDYQDAVKGPLPYDLLNLLEDARVDVPADLKSCLIERYCEGMDEEEKQNFKSWYRVLAAQFHSRVIGLFIMQAAENNRDDYLEHVPRLQNYLTEALKDPLLAPLKSWLEKEKVDFPPLNDLNGEQIRNIFADLKE